MGLTLQQLQQEGAIPVSSLSQGNSGGQKFSLQQLQQEGATPITSNQQPSNDSGFKNFLSDEGNALKAAYKEASSPQDLASPFAGSGHISDALVNIPVKHALSGINSVLRRSPTIAGYEDKLDSVIQKIKETAPAQAVSSGMQNFYQNHPRLTAAGAGLGSSINAGLTVSSLGQGALRLKDAFTHAQQVPGITKTLVENLNYDPSVASDISSTLANNGKVASYISQGNFDGAKAIIANATQGATGTALSDLQTAYHAIDDLSRVGFAPTTLGNVASTVGNAISNTGGVLKNLATYPFRHPELSAITGYGAYRKLGGQPLFGSF